MSDYNSSLPVRTQSNGDLAIKVVDAVTTSQGLAVSAAGSVTAELGATTLAALESITVQNPAGASAVNIQDGGNSITVDGTVELGATTLAALESITVQNGAGVSAVNIQDGGNSITVDGTVELGATSLAALESITVQNAAGASAVNIQDGGNSITVDGTVELGATSLAALESITIGTALPTGTNTVGAILIKDGAGDTLGVNADGSINVNVTATASTPVVSYTTSSAVAAAASVNHDYTVTAAKTLSIKQIIAAGSGKIKVQVLVNAVVKAVAFNSAANPTITLPLENLLQGTATQVVRITISNVDNQAQDVYSTLLGSEA